jgi:hypothetical protein
LAQKGIFLSPKIYPYVFGDFSCYSDIGECLKYSILLLKPGQNGLGRCLNIVLLYDKAEEWYKRPVPKKIYALRA